MHRVNCNASILFHHPCIFGDRHGTFATGGCDKRVNIWDGQNRKRIANIGGFPTRYGLPLHFPPPSAY